MGRHPERVGAILREVARQTDARAEHPIAAAARELGLSRQRVAKAVKDALGRPARTRRAAPAPKRSRASARADNRADEGHCTAAALEEAAGSTARAAEILGLNPGAVQKRIARSEELRVVVARWREPGKVGRPRAARAAK